MLTSPAVADENRNNGSSPGHLKRYEGFDHGLNIVGRARGGPYLKQHPDILRNKSPSGGGGANNKKTKNHHGHHHHRKEAIENLSINNFSVTPNEKKSSTESNDSRFSFLGNLILQPEVMN